MSGIPAPALVVVTGAGSGIGRATAAAYAATGARVVCLDLDLAAATATATRCGTGSLALECDVADGPRLAELAQQVADEHGPVDVLVNNAGVGLGGDFLDGSAGDWEWIRSVNLDGVVHGCRAFGPAMLARRRGQVVNVASGLAFLPTRRTAAYCTTKAAVTMFSRCLRSDWGRYGVGVSVVCPGIINTPVVDATRTAGLDEAELRRSRWLFDHGHAPEKVARAIVGAAARDRALVPVGLEAHLARAGQLLPGALRTAVGRW